MKQIVNSKYGFSKFRNKACLLLICNVYRSEVEVNLVTDFGPLNHLLHILVNGFFEISYSCTVFNSYPSIRPDSSRLTSAVCVL